MLGLRPSIPTTFLALMSLVGIGLLVVLWDAASVGALSVSVALTVGAMGAFACFDLIAARRPKVKGTHEFGMVWGMAVGAVFVLMPMMNTLSSMPEARPWMEENVTLALAVPAFLFPASIFISAVFLERGSSVRTTLLMSGTLCLAGMVGYLLWVLNQGPPITFTQKAEVVAPENVYVCARETVNGRREMACRNAAGERNPGYSYSTR